MSGIVVQKYGGSSVADAAGIKRVAARIAATRRDGKQVCVVVSAMGKTTDLLVERAREITDAPPRRELDMLLTCGERASMALLSMAVMEQGFEAISFTGSQSGIMTNDRHSGARIIEVRPIRVEDELNRGRVVIVAGFQGVSYKREITTLGRGGSDTTAVALAAALGADYCEICSDVDGIYTADPRVVDAAELLQALTHDEMTELSAHGAKVLHAESIEFARQADIALYARATAGTGAGTRVDRIGDPKRAGAAGVTGCKNLVRVTADDMDALVEAAASHSLPVFYLSSGRLYVGLDDVPDWSTIRGSLETAGATVTSGCGAVSIVSSGIGADAKAIATARRIASESGVAIDDVSTSALRITLYCPEADVDALTVALHGAFCEQP